MSLFLVPSDQPPFRRSGGFLVRVSENRFGYTLSYRVEDRCRHYIVEQDSRGHYALVGIPKVRITLTYMSVELSLHLHHHHHPYHSDLGVQQSE